MTASLVLNRAVELAKWLQSVGYRPGDYISTNTENSLHFAPIPVATFLIGATFAPLNPDYTPGKCFSRLKCDDNIRDKISRVVCGISFLRTIS